MKAIARTVRGNPPPLLRPNRVSRPSLCSVIRREDGADNLKALRAGDWLFDNLNMPPGFPLRGTGGNCPRNAEHIRKFRVGYASPPQCAHLENIRFTQLSPTVTDAHSHPLLGYCILHVVLASSEKQMCRIAAEAIVAPMANMKMVGGESAKYQQPSDAMSAPENRLTRFCADATPYCSVSSSIRRPRPRPTGIGAARHINLWPKPESKRPPGHVSIIHPATNRGKPGANISPVFLPPCPGGELYD